MPRKTAHALTKSVLWCTIKKDPKGYVNDKNGTKDKILVNGGNCMEIKMIPARQMFQILGFYTSFRFSWNENYIFTGESHNFWEVVCVLSGEVEITEDEKVYHLGANNIIFHAPMEFHRIKSHNGTTPTGLIMSFASEGEIPSELKNGVFTLSDQECRQYRDIFDKIYRCVRGSADEQGIYDSQIAASLFSAFLIELSARETAGSHTLFESSSPTALLYKRIVSSMRASVCQNLSLEDFSRSNNVSISYLKLLFKKYAGISPKVYYTKLRVAHAVSLIEKGMPISDVAEQMSFSSPNYFSEFFKRNTGVSPSEYKKGEKPFLW